MLSQTDTLELVVGKEPDLFYLNELVVKKRLLDSPVLLSAAVGEFTHLLLSFSTASDNFCLSFSLLNFFFFFVFFQITFAKGTFKMSWLPESKL